jgi:hypothetical protein
MARLKFRTDGTIALFDPSDDPLPPFPEEALKHLPPTLPSQASEQAQPQLPNRQLKRSRTFQPSKARLRLTHRHSHWN